MTKSIQLKRNISKNYIYIFLQNLDLTRGIWMIYLAAKGMNLVQIGLLETTFHIVSFTMEIPTGAIADIYGRKASRILGRISSVIATLILLFSTNFYYFAIAFAFSALSYNLESGAGDALVYDSLKEIGEEGSYMKISGNVEMFYQLASIASFLVGGYLATKNYNLVFIIAIIIGVINIAQAFSFKEPNIEKEHNEEGNIFIRQLRQSISIVMKNSRLGFLIIFVQLVMTFCTSIGFYLQNYLKGNGYNEFKIGVIYAISALTTAIVVSQAHKIEKVFKERGLLLVMPFITIGCIWGVASSKYNFIYFIVLMVTQGITYVAIGDYINKIIPSENRATILSFSSMLFSFFMITIFPLIGLIGDRFSLIIAFKGIAALGGILVILNSAILFKKFTNTVNESNSTASMH